jgi:hypothetical protein
MKSFSTFPFNNFESTKVNDLSVTAERNFLIQDIIYRVGNEYTSFDAVMVGLRFLQFEVKLDFRIMKFLDCMGKKSSNSYYASSFGFKNCSSIESYLDDYNEAIKISKEILAIEKIGNKQNEKINSTKFKLYHGTMQDYFQHDANIIFIDVSVFQDTMIDEVTILSLLFKLCTNVLPGVFLIVVSSMTDLNSSSLLDVYNVRHIDFVHTETLCNQLCNKSKLRYDSKLWILKTIFDFKSSK